MLCLYRPRTQKPFSRNEQILCMHLMPYIAHALQSDQGERDLQYSDSGHSGMMVIDSRGTVLFLSEAAKRLLLLTLYPLKPRTGAMKEAGVLPQLGQMCRNLDAIFRGKDAAPPSYTYINCYGRFLFRSYWLTSQSPEPGGLIGMTIEHQEPLLLKIMRAMQGQPLSPTQMEVAMMLAQGISSETIGERLHIKQTTVKDHIGKIFTKLDIHHREELLARLLDQNLVMPFSNRQHRTN